MRRKGKKRPTMAEEELSAFRAGVDAAIRRAAIEARRRTIETSG